jgi:hypothetical protein
MLQKEFLEQIARLVGVAANFQSLQFGTSNLKPASTDSGLKGTVVSSSPVQITVDGRQIKITAQDVPIPTGPIREFGLLGANDLFVDRLVTPDLPAALGAKVGVTYILDVVGEGVE